jgi:hypothetical protein
VASSDSARRFEVVNAAHAIVSHAQMKSFRLLVIRNPFALCNAKEILPTNKFQTLKRI